MKLGIDFGTTRTTIAVADRGNYPVVSFDDNDGNARDHIPSMVALVHGQLVYGFEGVKAAKPVRTHWDMLLERRSMEELEDLLNEQLGLLREGRLRPEIDYRS